MARAAGRSASPALPVERGARSVGGLVAEPTGRQRVAVHTGPHRREEAGRHSPRRNWSPTVVTTIITARGR